MPTPNQPTPTPEPTEPVDPLAKYRKGAASTTTGSAKTTTTAPAATDPLSKYRGSTTPAQPAVTTKAAAQGEKVTNPEKYRDRNIWQDFFDVLGTPGSLAAGAWAAMADKNNKFEVKNHVITINGKQLIDYAIENATAPWEGRERKSFIDVAQSIAGTEDNLGAVLGGLAFDVVVDPLNVVPGGAVMKGTKAVTRFGVDAAKGAVLGAKGVVPEVVAGARAATTAKTINRAPTYIKQSTGSEASRAIEAAATEKAQANALKMVQLNVERGAAQAVADIAASAAVSAWKGMKQSLLTSNTKLALRENARFERKAVKAAEKAAKKAGAAVEDAPLGAVGAAENLAETITKSEEFVKDTLKPVDTDPIADVVAQEIKTPHSIEVAKQLLNDADVVAKKTRATLPDSSQRAGAVMDVLKGVAEKPLVKIAAGAKTVINKAASSADPLDLQAAIRESASETQAALNALQDTVATTAGGQTVKLGEIFDAIRSGRTTFAKLPEATQDAVRKALLDAVAPRTSIPGQAALKQISDLVGEAVAREIHSTGATTKGLNEETTAKVYEILKKLPTAKTRSYKSASEMIDGIQAGDKISPTALFNLLKALDPENKILEAGVKAASTPDGIKAIQSLLVTTGRNSIKSTEARLRMLDPENLLNEKNMPFSAAAQVAADRAMQGIANTDPAVLRESRQTAMRELEALETGEYGSMVRNVLDSVGRGLRTQFGKIAALMDDEKVLIHENIAGRLAVSEVVDHKVVKSFLPEPFSQYVETKIWASILAKESMRRDIVVAKAAKKKERAVFSRSRFEQVASSYDVLRTATLATFGSRLINVRAVKEAGKEENLYNVYTDFGDFAEVVAGLERTRARRVNNPLISADDVERAEELADAANKAFFPVESGVKTGQQSRKVFRKENSFSPQGVGRAVNKMLESMDKGIEYPRDEMVKDILSRASSDTRKWSASFAEAAEDRAKAIATIIRENAEFFAERHTARMLAEIEDMARPAQIMAADLFTPILDAARVYAERGTYTLEQRAQLVSDALHKFAIGSDLFNQQNGYIAMTAFRSAARIFITVGGLEDAIKLAGNTLDDLPVQARFLRAVSVMRRGKDLAPEFQKFIDGINTYSVSVNNSAELLTNLSKAQRDRIGASLTKAEMAYETLAKKLMNPEAGDDLAQAESDFKKAQRALDKAREAARGAKLPTRHWSYRKAADGAPDGWVASRDYDRAAEIGFLNKNGIDLPTDLAEKVILGEKLTAAEIKQINKIREEQNLERVRDLIEIGADDLEERVAEVERLFPDDEIEQGMRLAEEQMDAVARDARIVLDEPLQFVYSTTYKSLKASAKGELNVENASWLSRFDQHFSAVGEKALVRALYNSEETKVLNAVGDVHQFFARARRAFLHLGTTGEQFSAAFTLAARGVDQLSGNANVDRLAADLNQVMSASIEKMKAMNIDMTLFAKVLAKHGVSPDNGFVNVRDFNDPEDLFNLFKDMPFAEKPAFDLDSIAGREASLRWDERNVAWKDHLKKTGRQEADTAFSVLAKVVDSIQFTVMQQTISKQLVARFNFEAEGKTYAQAIKEGYVTLTGSGNQFNFFLPGELSPEAGNLFHPDIAKSIAWINREHNRTFSSGNMPKWAHGVLQTTQFFKAFQTVMRPGHWFTNTIGDTSTAMLAGALNPKHWKMAASLAGEFAKSNIKADSRLFGELEDSLGRALGSLDGLGGRAFDMVEKQGQKHYQFVVGGKRISIPTSELLKLMKDHNVVAGDIHVNDSAMLYQEIAAHAGGDKKGNSVVLSKLSQGFNRSAFGLAFQKVIKPAGDMVAYTGNIPRIAHALHVMQGQNWSSVKAMLEGANDKLSLYHPMVQSLTATERKTARVAFSYYTWLRVAHNTMLDLTLNHTAATMIPPKIFYAMSEASGNDPQSVGNLWGDKTKTPEYLDYSVYGPNMTGVRGPMVWRPPILTMDVMSTWNTAFDPAISDDANLWENIGKVATNLVSQSNMVLQPIGQIATKTNPSTGAPERITSTGQFIDKYYGMLPFTRVAEALGAPNPFVDKSKKANPPTERDKELTILNYLFGQRLMDVNKPSSLKNAKTENNQKLKDIATLINEQKQKESK